VTKGRGRQHAKALQATRAEDTHNLARLPELDDINDLLREHDGEAEDRRDEGNRKVGDEAVDSGEQLGLVEEDARRKEGRDGVRGQA
jgi:hypothetical protein